MFSWVRVGLGGHYRLGWDSGGGSKQVVLWEGEGRVMKGVAVRDINSQGSWSSC